MKQKKTNLNDDYDEYHKDDDNDGDDFGNDYFSNVHSQVYLPPTEGSFIAITGNPLRLCFNESFLRGKAAQKKVKNPINWIPCR